uniref:SH2 domain-containing protein n=1 Tax=Mesocestoides corti TaxID=53468 RepID=A0A5K3FRI2_MESCO
MRARISQFEDVDLSRTRNANFQRSRDTGDSPARSPPANHLDWREVRLRVRRQEEEHRRAVVAARRSLHLDVHVGGGEYAASTRFGKSTSHGPTKPSITDLVVAQSASSTSNDASVNRFGVASTSALLEASLICADVDGGSADKSGTLRLQKTFGASAIMDWFRECEAPHLLASFRDPSNPGALRIPTWFHGPLKRLPSEALLQGQRANSFLVRISDSFLGYILTHINADAACTHVFVNLVKPLVINDGEQEGAETRLYHLHGQKPQFPSLLELVNYYRDHSIMPHDELYLQYPVGQTISKVHPVADYFPLLFHRNSADKVTVF